jgi:GNAT superfamily N-acetyltransferase
MLDEASRMLARAFLANPLHVAAFGGEQLRSNEAFFHTALRLLKGRMLVARDSGRIVGFVHWVHAPLCQFTLMERLRLMPQVVASVGFPGALRVASWLGEWASHDPDTPHTHLGPIGVEPSMQGRGVGEALMQQYCDELDRTGAVGYLETDRHENVRFYRRFGFSMADEIDVLGARNYLMQRPPRSL